MKEKEILNALKILNEDHQIDANALTKILENDPKDVSKWAQYTSIMSKNYASELYDIYKRFIEAYEVVYKELKASAVIVKNKKDVIKYMDYWCKQLNCESERVIEIFKYAESALINQTFLMILKYGMNNIEHIKELSNIFLAHKMLESSKEDSAKELYDAIIDPTTNEIGIIEIVEEEYYKSSRFTSRKRIAGTKKEMILTDILKLKEPIPCDSDDTYEVPYSRDDSYTYGTKIEKKFLPPEKKSEGIEIYKKALLFAKLKQDLSKDEDGFILYADKVLKISKSTLIKNGVDPNFVNWKSFKYSIDEMQSKFSDKEIRSLSNKILKKKLR